MQFSAHLRPMIFITCVAFSFACPKLLSGSIILPNVTDSASQIVEMSSSASQAPVESETPTTPVILRGFVSHSHASMGGTPASVNASTSGQPALVVPYVPAAPPLIARLTGEPSWIYSNPPPPVLLDPPQWLGKSTA